VLGVGPPRQQEGHHMHRLLAKDARASICTPVEHVFAGQPDDNAHLCRATLPR
jgi:hypothetical protein